MINKYFYDLSVVILGGLFLIFFLTTVGFIFHLSVNHFYIILPSLAGIYYLKKNSETNYDFLKQLLILLLIILFSYTISLYFWDSTFDGRSYHLASVLLLKNGWNPVYDNIEQITIAHNMYIADTQWGNWFVKFCEITGANIYKFTGYIESTKTINWLMFFAAFMYIYSVLNSFFEKKSCLKFLIALITVINPVCICQLLNNLIDINLYYAFAILIFTILKTEKENNITNYDIFFIIVSSVILSNCKFTGSVYLFIIFVCWFVYYLINKQTVKKLVLIGTSILMIIVLTGINPYFTNIKNYGNPMYPILGQNKFDFADTNLDMPVGFKEMNNFKRFLYGHFSETTNSLELIEGMGTPVNLKIPFTITKNEEIFNIPDMRTGGFGYFWSGIFILLLLSLPFIRFKTKEDKKIFFFILSTLVLTILANPHNWWARYIPQFWFLPVLILLFLNNSSSEKVIYKNLKITFNILICFFILLNCSIVFAQNFLSNFVYTYSISTFYDDIKNNAKKDGIYLMQDKEYTEYYADETIVPHLKELNIKITEVPFDINKIKNGEFITLQPFNIVYKPCFFYKIKE